MDSAVKSLPDANETEVSGVTGVLSAFTFSSHPDPCCHPVGESGSWIWTDYSNSKTGEIPFLEHKSRNSCSSGPRYLFS